MKGLNWRSAFRRAAIFTLIWLGIVYVTSRVFPQSFGIEIPEELPFLALNALFFFFIFAVFSAFSERRRARFAQQNANKNRVTKEKPQGENGEGGHLKGRPNPNTSRKKARRRR